ncbi:CHAT domain-containing protein [Mycena leptocephala]|nr:CHAT domain-containing protein [Mycena leptocephala]
MIGQMADLDKAIHYHQQSLSFRPESSSLHHLANDLIKLHEESGSLSALKKARDLQEKRIDSLPEDHAMLHLALIGLGKILLLEFLHCGFKHGMTEALRYHRKALNLCPPGPTSHDHQRRILVLNSFVSCYRVTIHALPSGEHTMEVVEEAIELGKEAERLLPDGHPLLVGLRRDLAVLHLNLAEPMYDQAFHLFRRAAGQETGTIRDRLSAAMDWAAFARLHSHPSTDAAYSTALEQLHRCLIASLTVDSQHRFLSRHSTRIMCETLVADAASFAIQNNENNRAVEIIEQGRTFIWSIMRGYRHPVDQLRRADPTRAAHFQRLSADVERFAVTFEVSSLSFPLSWLTSGAGSASHRKLAEEWQNKLDEIRTSVPGFQDFLRPLPFIRLRRAAAEGPVILLNRSKHGSNALIILKTSRTPVSVPLHGKLSQAGYPVFIHDGPGRLHGSREGLFHADVDQEMEYLMRDMWQEIVEPIVGVLRSNNVPEMSRIWWCPTGVLGTLPLHAAGQYQHNTKNLPEIYISSYTPTLSALITAREVVSQDRGCPPNLLLVAVHQRPGARRLPGVLAERDMVRSLVPVGKNLFDEAASCNAVLQDLRDYPWVHFATHARQHRYNPLHSTILLHGENLELHHFMSAHPPNARLAVLLACETASAAAFEKMNPDEALHLAAAIQFCGFCSVVGTLWSMNDACGPHVASSFYHFLLRNGSEKVNLKDSAQALNMATRELRSNGVKPGQWINFVHIGV